MKTGFIAIALLLIAAPALADPLPAGRCSLMDNGVVNVAPPAEVKGKEENPHIIAMALPKSVLRHDGAVVDVVLQIGADGAVTSPRILCTSWDGRGVEGDLLKSVPNWRFSPMIRNGKAVAAEAAYRIVIGGTVIPLSYNARTSLQKIEG